MNSFFLICKAMHICFHKRKPDKVHKEKIGCVLLPNLWSCLPKDHAVVLGFNNYWLAVSETSAKLLGGQIVLSPGLPGQFG